MSNDPKEAKVDMTKLTQGGSQQSGKESTLPFLVSSKPQLITSLNENDGTGLIGLTYFSEHDENSHKKDDWY